MTLTNLQILNYTEKLQKAFEGNNKLFPITVIFYIQKNQNTLNQLASELEEFRINLVKQYGDLSEDGQYYNIKPEYQETVQKKITDLMEIKQKVEIHKIKLTDLAGVSLSKQEMDAIIFMIDDEEDEDAD